MQPLAVILQEKGLISVGAGTDGPIPEALLQALVPHLSYTHVHTLFGAAAYDRVTGERRPVRYEHKKLYALDGLGRLNCQKGYIPRITRAFEAAGYRVALEDVAPKDARVYEEDWDNVVAHFQFRARQDECLAAIAAHPGGGLIHAAAGFGKAQPLDSMVQTPNGPCRMGDIRVGDVVCTPHGGVTRVVAVHPQGEKEVFRVRFRDGDTVECCNDHLWRVVSPLFNWAGPKVVSTEYLRARCVRKDGLNPLKIELPQPLALSANTHDWVISPYFMGVLIANGAFTGSNLRLITGDTWIVERLQPELRDGVSLKKVADYAYNFVRDDHYPRPNIYKQELKRVGLWGHLAIQKFIPEEYLLAGVSARLDLLRGLMDSDGHVSKKGRLVYSTSSPALARDVKRLVESLGGLCRVSRFETDYNPRYQCYVRLLDPHVAVSMPRKYAFIRDRQRCRLMRAIVAVEPAGRKPCQCLTVAAADGLYLTDNCIVTHNSFLWSSVGLLYPRANIAGVVPGLDILRGMVQDMSQYIPNVGQVGGGVSRVGRITLYSVDSLVNRSGSVRPDILLVDEVHVMVAPTYAEALARVGESARCYGFSANVGDRRDGADALMEGQYGPIIFSLSTQEATELGLIVPIQVVWHDVIMDYNPAAGKSGIYRHKYGIWRNEVRNQEVAAAARLYGDDDQVLIMVSKVEHAAALQALLPEFQLCHGPLADEKLESFIKRGLLPRGYQPLSADGRIALRDDFRAGKVKKVIATDVWAKGVSFESLAVLIRADARGSAICDTQIPSRTSRIHAQSGKAHGTVHDFSDQFDEGFRKVALSRRRNYDDKGWTQVGADGRPISMRRKHAS